MNPSNEDQRAWYRGLGREEAQREMREKILKKLSILDNHINKPVDNKLNE